MMRYMIDGGATMWPILLLAVVIVALILANAVRLFVKRKADARTQSSINAILFWGAVAVAVGLLGQWSGLLRNFTIMAELGLSSPNAFIKGFLQMLIPAIAGFTVFIVAAPCWFVLHGRCRALRTADPHDHAGGQ